MKRLAMLAAVLALISAGCTKDGDDTTVSPSSVITLAAQMSGTQEVPVANPPEATGVGTAQVIMTPAAGGAYTATFTFSISGLVRAGVLPAPLDSGSVIVAGHIHQGVAGVAGPVLVPLPISQAAPLVSPTGSVLITFSNVAVSADAATAILANPPGFYINLHSALNPAGVVRGQLVKQ